MLVFGHFSRTNYIWYSVFDTFSKPKYIRYLVGILLFISTLPKSPGQPLGVVADRPSPHPPGHLLTGQHARAYTPGSHHYHYYAIIIIIILPGHLATQELHLLVPAGQESPHLELVWERHPRRTEGCLLKCNSCLLSLFF